MSAPLRAIGRLHPKTSALFVCDVQERFRSHIHAVDSLISTAQKMIGASNILSIPIYVTEQYPQRLGGTFKELDITTAEKVLPKTRFSMLLPEIQESLQTKEIRSVVLLGIESHVCVMQTALDLLENNYDVHVVADGVSSMNYPEIQVALERMKQSGAFVATSESILFQLTGDAKAPNFKAVSNLVKDFQTASKENKLLFKSSV